LSNVEYIDGCVLLQSLPYCSIVPTHFSEVKNLSYIQILAIPVFHNHTYVAISFVGRFVCSPIFGQGFIQPVETFRGDLAKTFAFRDRYDRQQA
jgi:hypothetical protein